jgi:hypothetical protein
VPGGGGVCAGTVGIMSETALPAQSSGSPLEPAGRKLLRLEVRNSQVPIERKPEWIKTRLKTGPEYTELKSLVRREGLHTVCEEAGCPNIYECWEDREATSSSVATSAPGAATSARSTPASPLTSTATSRGGSRRASPPWA